MSNYLEDEPERFAEIFKALSNPNRLRIFLRLVSCCRSGTICSGNTELRTCVGEIGGNMAIAPSTVSHHLKELRRAGLIRMERVGQRVECWVDPAVLEDLAEFFAHRIGE